MKFVILAFLFIGQSFALLDPILGLVGVIPALENNVRGLNNIRDAVSILSKTIAESADASVPLSIFTSVFESAAAVGVVKQFGTATSNLATSLTAITDNFVLSLNLLNLRDLVSKLNKEADAENAVSSLFVDINKGTAVDTSSGYLRVVADALQNVVTAKQDLIVCIKKFKGISGAAFGLIATVLIRVTKALDDLGVEFGYLAAAIQSKASDLPSVDFDGVVSGFFGLSTAEGCIAEAIRDLMQLPRILDGVLQLTL